MATPRARSTLPFHANITAPACSAAFPTIGKRIAAKKIPDTPASLAASWIESEIASDNTAIKAVMIASHIKALLKPRTSSSSSSSSS